MAWSCFALIECAILLFFSAIIYTTRPLHETDVSYVTVQASDVFYYKSVNHGQDFSANDLKFSIGSRFKGYLYKAVEDEEEITFIVDSSYPFKRRLGVVGIQGENGVYYGLEENNAYNAWVPYVYVPLCLIFNGLYIMVGTFLCKISEDL